MAHSRRFFPLVAWEVTHYYFSFLFLVWSWSQDRETKHLSHDWLNENYVWKLFRIKCFGFYRYCWQMSQQMAAQKPYWKFLTLPCIKWDLYWIQINLKVRLTNVSKSDWRWSNVINGLMTKSRENTRLYFHLARQMLWNWNVLISNVNHFSDPIMNTNTQKPLAVFHQESGRLNTGYYCLCLKQCLSVLSSTDKNCNTYFSHWEYREILLIW